MLKVKDFVKKHYILVTVIAVVIIIPIAIFLTISLINGNRPKVKKSKDSGAYYQVLHYNKYDFNAELYKENGITKSIVGSKYDILSVVPIYYKEENQMILTDDSAITFYLQGFKSYKLPKYSEVISKDGNNFVLINNKKVLVHDALIYDVNRNYIVLDKVKLKYNGVQLELSPLSFVSAGYDGLTYYDYESGKKVFIDDEIDYAYLLYDTFNVDLIANVVNKDGMPRQINGNVDSLKTFKED